MDLPAAATFARTVTWPKMFVLFGSSYAVYFLFPELANLFVDDAQVSYGVEVAWTWTYGLTGLLLVRVVLPELGSEHIGWVPAAPRWYFAAVAVLAVTWIAAAFLSSRDLGFEGDYTPSVPDSAEWFWLELLGSAVLVPLAEELLFRSLLFRLLQQRWGLGAGYGLSALAFFLWHGEAAATVHFLFGLTVAFLFVRSKSIKPCVFAHGLHNALVTMQA